MTPKAYETLAVLIRDAGQVVRKQALMDEVWGDTFVEESVLTQNIYTLRRALNDSGPSHRFITTVPRIGYRFIASVKAVHDHDPDTAPTLNSLAVIPFESLNPGEDEKMLSLGMTDALITRLSGIRSLSVRPTSSVLATQARLGEKGMHLIGTALGVDAVVEGRIQLSKGRVRATVQLVEVASQSPLWGEQFDTDEQDLFAVQDSISKQIADKLRLELTSQERDRLSQGTQSDEAYRAYLRGRYFWNRREAASLRNAIECFTEASSKDPNWALPQAGLADCFALLPLYGDQPAKESFAQARQAAVRALEIEPDLAEAHTSLAYARLIHDWDAVGAEHSWRKAIQLQPRYATARHWLGFALAGMGRFEEAVIQASRAVELDPLSLVINADLGWVH